MKKVSRKIITRALLYIRVLENLAKEKRFLISSGELAGITGLTDVQIRKDISNFGRVGTPRIGYKTLDLKNTLKDFVLQKNIVRIGLFGVGNLGMSIMRYPGFQTERIKLSAAFDKAKNKVKQSINGIKVYPLAKVPDVINRKRITIGIIAVPPEASQEVADIMVMSGLKGIMNFSSKSINVPKEILVKNIDFSIEILSLFCSTYL